MNVDYFVKAIKDYKGKADGELSFKKGWEIQVKFYDLQQEKYFGKLKDTVKQKEEPRDGWFPSRYVARVEESPRASPSRPPATKSVSTFFKSKKKSEPSSPVVKRVFGVPLESLPLLPLGDNWVPSIVAKIAQFLLKHKVLEQEGIFRVSGRALEMEKIKRMFNEEEDPQLSDDLDPNSVAGIFKQFLRELPEPLFTYPLYEEWLQFITGGDFDEFKPGQKVEEFHKLFAKLPARNQNLIRFLSDLCAEVIAHKDKNMMHSGNLGIVFGPSLLRNPKASDDKTDIGSTSTITRVVEFMIDHHHLIFPASSLDVNVICNSKFGESVSPRLGVSFESEEVRKRNTMTLTRSNKMPVQLASSKSEDDNTASVQTSKFSSSSMTHMSDSNRLPPPRSALSVSEGGRAPRSKTIFMENGAHHPSFVLPSASSHAHANAHAPAPAPPSSSPPSHAPPHTPPPTPALSHSHSHVPLSPSAYASAPSPTPSPPISPSPSLAPPTLLLPIPSPSTSSSMNNLHSPKPLSPTRNSLGSTSFTNESEMPHKNRTATEAPRHHSVQIVSSSSSAKAELSTIDKNIMGAMAELRKRITEANKEIHNLMVSCGNSLFTCTNVTEALPLIKTLTEVRKTLDNFLEQTQSNISDVYGFLRDQPPPPASDLKEDLAKEPGSGDAELLDLKQNGLLLTEESLHINYFIQIKLSNANTKEQILALAQITKALKMLLLPNRITRRPMSTVS